MHSIFCTHCHSHVLLVLFLPFYLTINAYFRYIESGCYRGFMRQVRQQIISTNPGTHPERILLWNVYLMQTFNSNRIYPLHIQAILVLIFLFIDIFHYKISYVCLTILQICINECVLNTTLQAPVKCTIDFLRPTKHQLLINWTSLLMIFQLSTNVLLFPH